MAGGSPSKERIARNETIFRAINARVDEVRDSQAGKSDFLCECGNLDCTETVPMTREEYQHVRSDSATFAVVPGHTLEDVESVVETTDRFHVVRKHPEEAQIANATDPTKS